jgi:hypothetical protein
MLDTDTDTDTDAACVGLATQPLPARRGVGRTPAPRRLAGVRLRLRSRGKTTRVFQQNNTVSA